MRKSILYAGLSLSVGIWRLNEKIDTNMATAIGRRVNTLHKVHTERSAAYNPSSLPVKLVAVPIVHNTEILRVQQDI